MRASRSLERQLSAIREPAMRQRALARTLATWEPAEAVTALDALLERHRRRPSADTALALETLAAALTAPDVLPYPVRADLYEAAVDLGCDAVRRMLLDASPAAPPGDDPAAERPLRPKGRPLTLGERKALARGHARGVLEALLRDPHPAVIRILLANPHITERDVLAIATHRPGRPDALAEIARSDRWIARYRVKRALVFHPDTPAHIAIRLLATLHAADLHRAAGDENLPAPVREQAAALVARGATA